MRLTVPWSRFLLAGIALLVVTVGVSAALAPPIQQGVTDAGGDGNETRKTLVGSHGGGAGFHEYGSVYLLDGTDVAWREDSADSNFEVERLPDGSVLAGFADGGYSDCPSGNSCTHTGYRVIDPGPNPEVVGEYSFPVETIKNSEAHAAEPLPGGGVAVTDMDEERLFVVEGGQIVWEWRASSFYDPPSDPGSTDWLHINDVDYIGDDRFLLSVRNANQILVIERGSGVVEVINEDRGGNDSSCTGSGQLSDTDGDGDVRCGNPELLDHQHNPQWLGEGAVLVADSDNNRVVELHRTDDGRWEAAWALSEAGGIGFSWPRDADRLPNGNTLVTDTLNERLVEVDEEGNVIWSVSTERIPYEADRLVANDSNVTTYDEGTVATPGEGGLPVLSTLTMVAHSAVPALPYWFEELQVLGTLVSLVFVLAGGVQWYRQRKGTR